MSYKHGIYTESGSASRVADLSQGTVPIYIGTLPSQRIDEEKLKKVKHGKSENCIMLLVNSYSDIKALNIYSEDWETYSLCEAMDVHFVKGNVGPIILIGNLQSEKDEQTTTKTVPVTKSGTSYVGYLEDSRVDVSTLAVTVSGASLEDGDVSFSYEGDKIKIVITKSGFTGTSVSATYNTVAQEKLSVSVFTEALELAERAENITNKVPNILCAPQYSNSSEYHDLMVQAAIEKLAGKWSFIVASDVINENITSKETAIAWKNTNSYNNVLDKVYFPKIAYGDRVYHLSVIATATMQSVDFENDNIPYESVSNKAILADRIVDNDGVTIYFSEKEANELNQKGITTAISMKGEIRLWGSHMANYDFENLESIAPEERKDIAVRMSVYLKNYLQYNYLDEVDKTITRKDIDSIINSVQMWLDSLVNAGMLLYATVGFDDESDIENGDIAFNIHVTYPFIAKSITFKVISTDEGLVALTASGEGGNE